MFPEGLYSGKLVSKGKGASKDKKTPYIYAEFMIGHIASAKGWDPVPAPDKRTVTMYLTDDAWPSTEKKLDSLGFKGDFNNIEFDPDCEKVGVELRCRHEPYQDTRTGTTKNSEKWELENWGGERHAPIDDASKLDVFSARWKQRTAAASPVGGGTVQTSAGSFPTNQAGSPPGAQAAGSPGGTSTAPPAPGTPTAPRTSSGGPPPMAVTAPPVTKQTRTRDQVWQAATRAHPDVPTDVMGMEWSKAIAELRPGKAENSFTGEDWFAVECRLVAPF